MSALLYWGISFTCGLALARVRQRGAEILARYGGKGMRVQRRLGIEAVSDVMTRVEPARVDGILANEEAMLCALASKPWSAEWVVKATSSSI